MSPLPVGAEAPPVPFPVADPSVTHVVIELFGGDNNLSPFVLEDLGEMAAGMRGPFAVLALADFASSGASVIELTATAEFSKLIECCDAQGTDRRRSVGQSSGAGAGSSPAPDSQLDTTPAFPRTMMDPHGGPLSPSKGSHPCCD